MLIFTAISPHPPILIPTIGKENLEQIKKTQAALEKLNKQLIELKPDTIIIISPHGPFSESAFSIGFSKDYQGNFKQFGDFVTELKFKADVDLIHQVKEKIEKEIPISLLDQPELDHGALIPLYYLTKGLENFSIVPIGYSTLDYKTHLKFGELLKEEILHTEKKVAIIASGDLSHRLTEDAPGGYSPSGKTFDSKLIELLQQKDVEGILNLDPQLIEEAGECGLRPTLVLLGIIKGMNYTPELLSYEAPFGVGYLVMDFRLNT